MHDVTRRMRLRRFGQCAPEGTLVPGLARPSFRRVGAAVCCETTGQVKPSRAAFRRVGKTPDPCGGCTPGEVQFSFFDPTVHEIHTSSAVDPDLDVWVVPCVSFPACTAFRMTITSDVRTQDIIPSPSVTAQAQAFLSPAGLDVPSREFASFGTYVGRMRMWPPIVENNAWNNGLTWVSFEFNPQPFEDFAGPQPLQSIYFWPAAGFPVSEGSFELRNTSIQIVTVS